MTIRMSGLMGLAVVAFLVFTLPLRAEQKETDPLKFSVSIYGEYTDNRDSMPDNDPHHVLPEPDSCFDAYIKPRIDVTVRGEHGSSLDAHYAPYFRYRSNPSEIQNETELFHDLGIDGTFKPSDPIALRVSEAFFKTDDPSVEKNGITLRRDSSYMMNQFQGGANFQMKQTSLDLGGRSTIKRFDEELVAEESDEDSMGVCLTLWQQVGRTLAVIGVLDSASFGYYSTLGIVRDFDALSIGAGLQKNVSKALRFGLRAGMISVSYDSEAVEDDSAPFASLSVETYNLIGNKAEFQLTYQLRDAEVYPFPSQECIQFYTRIDKSLGSFLMLGLTGTYRVGTYSQETLDPAGFTTQIQSGYATEGDKTTLLAQGDLTYKLRETTFLRMALSHEDVSSDVMHEYARNAVSLTLMQQF